MLRSDLINIIIEKNKAKKYLEIGSSELSSINCEYKIGVYADLNYPKASDAFFDKNQEKFDVIFIDGLHYEDQVHKDIVNALSILNENGCIICHDMNPIKEEHQAVPYNGGIWNGDCWKAFVRLRQNRSDLEMFVVDTDHGCGIIKKGSQDTLPEDLVLNWQNFNENRVEWLNLISVDSFLCKITLNNEFIEAVHEVMLNKLLLDYLEDSEDCNKNYNLGSYYDSIGQTASALSYYLRAAERAKENKFQYECLLKSARCFQKQGCRNFTVKGLLQHALAVSPERPEAYYLLSKFYEAENKDGNWQECYTISSIGNKMANLNCETIKDVGYPGEYALLFQKAVSSWWCGLCKESLDIFKDLLTNYKLDSQHREAVINNLKRFNEIDYNKPINYYEKTKHDKLKFKFKKSEEIDINFSESYQDMFVLAVLDGKQEGTYLEIGSADPFRGSNTALLEQKFCWKGLSIDTDQNFVNQFSSKRKNLCLVKDGTTVDYKSLLKELNMPKNIDYLQIDCEPPHVNYDVLLNMPFDEYKFSVITYEHDHYFEETKTLRDLSRKHFTKYGYVLIAGNISPDDWKTYEDWWVHPDLVSKFVIDNMKSILADVINVEKYMLEGTTIDNMKSILADVINVEKYMLEGTT